jgi:FixJ family two-component response regulator
MQTICIVDDSDSIRQSFRTALEHAGYDITESASGRDFLESGLAAQVDCILLDLEMPHLNGIEVLDELRNSACATPVIVVTGTGDAALLAAAERTAVTAVLKKPISPDALLSAVNDALR